MDVQTLGFSVPLVLGITQVLKAAGLVDRLIPVSALIVGVAVAFLLAGVHGSSVVLGLVAGLSSMGLWSGTKATAGY